MLSRGHDDVVGEPEDGDGNAEEVGLRRGGDLGAVDDAAVGADETPRLEVRDRQIDREPEPDEAERPRVITSPSAGR